MKKIEITKNELPNYLLYAGTFMCTLSKIVVYSLQNKKNIPL